MPSTTSTWVKTKSDEAAVDSGCYFDLEAADRVRFFFLKFLRHSKGEFAGKPFELLDWQWERIIAPLFGWKAADGTRRFRRAGIAVPKKNGKSTLLSGIGLYMLCGDKEAGAEVYSAAASRDQAAIIYNEAANMVEASPALASHINLRRQAKEMDYQQCAYKALSADVPTKDGLNIHCLLFDELHTQKTWDLWNTLRYGFAARRQPLLLWISTAGVYSPEGIGYTQWQYARNVQEGVIIDPSFLACVYEAPESEDWKSEAAYAKCNPSYLKTLSKRDWAESVAEAIALPSNENNYKRYRLNQWVRQASKWIQMERWDACRNVVPPTKRGRCIIGLDLAATTDIAAAAALFKDGSKVKVFPHFWVPEDCLTRRRRENKTLLDAWCPKYITVTTDRPTLDYDRIREDLNKFARIYDVREIAIDPWNATQLATDLADDGFEVVYVRTGYQSISAATKELEKLILEGNFEHPDNPVLNWMMGNIAVEMDASGNIKPSKAKAAEKIDGVVAIILALARMIETPKKKKSRYETKGIEVL